LHLPDLYPDEEKAAIVEVAARLKGHAYAGEWHHLKADGSVITVVVRSHDIDYWGQDARIAVITDISDRKRAEEALRASEERFFKAFHATPDAIVISRVSDGLLLDVNDVFLRKLGYSREDIVDRKTVDLNVWVNSDDRERYITGVREQGRVRDMEAQFLSRTGAILDGLVSGETIMIGEELCLLTIVRDISERKKIERELEKHRIRLEEMVSERTAELEKSQLTLLKLVDDLNAKKDELAIAMEKAQAADQIKSSFLATMSHELRTPLNSIIGFTGILLQGLAGPLNQEQHKQMTMVQNSSRHLLALINDVLDISKIEAGELVLSPAPFDLRQSLEKTVRMVAPLAEKKGITLHLDIADTIGTIMADQRRLEQVMLNLLNNAVKFTDKGHVRISCREEDADYILSFADTGVGMRPEDIPNLFQPFRQIDSGLTRKHEGTGLGLSICKKIIDMMGGSISVESRWGEGSVFTVRLSKQSGGQS
jgi:PAS domain S-box-containing protein